MKKVPVGNYKIWDLAEPLVSVKEERVFKTSNWHCTRPVEFEREKVGAQHPK